MANKACEAYHNVEEGQKEHVEGQDDIGEAIGGTEIALIHCFGRGNFRGVAGRGPCLLYTSPSPRD